MKWIPIDKAKVKFGQLYLIRNEGDSPKYGLGFLLKSETTTKGVAHSFDCFESGTTVTHIAIITDPNKPE